MRWSKLKQQVEARFAEGVRGRVELRTTRYEKAHDRYGRSWITVDGREILNMANFLVWQAVNDERDPARFEAGAFAGYELPLAMREYLKLSIDDAIRSPHPLIRALAVLDRRAGRRRLARIDSASEVPVVRELLALRLGCGGAYDAANFGTITRQELLLFTGDVAEQIKDVPDGASVKFEWTK
jgi:hypothetical protein